MTDEKYEGVRARIAAAAVQPGAMLHTRCHRGSANNEVYVLVYESWQDCGQLFTTSDFGEWVLIVRTAIGEFQRARSLRMQPKSESVPRAALAGVA